MIMNIERTPSWNSFSLEEISQSIDWNSIFSKEINKPSRHRKSKSEKRYFVIHTCLNCSKSSEQIVGNLKFRIKKGTFTGLCQTCTRLFRLPKAKEHYSWKGGYKKTNQGYVLIHKANIPEENYHLITFDRSNYVLEHKYIMSLNLQRHLYPDETVHHLNGIRDDNRIENLELWASNHPKGQRISDLLSWAQEIVKKYAT